MTETENPPLRRTASQVVYENRWMRVTEDATVRDNGTTGIFGVVHKPDFALVVPYDGTRVHLVEQYRYPVDGRFWEFPQGSWETKPDADPMDVARGELAEETGLRAGSMTLLGHLYEAYGFSDQGFNVVLASDLTQGERALEESESDLRNGEFTLEEMWGLIASGQCKDAPSIAALALLQRHLSEA
ncbi:NUDIX domain-containing protein [Kribbella deserti]|uniref:NUDIX domain-containing protein n=1 Tax=Kribbella deserti TaxID=1926257 RepID=A0ABV6QVD2_9ACTN